MNKFKLTLLMAILSTLLACTPTQKITKPTTKIGYLKENISQADLSNPALYKRYYYTCYNAETGSETYLSSYFPLSKESRLPHNFGIYVLAYGGKAEPFDHIENRQLNARGTRFEVIYRSYQPIQGTYIDLVASQHKSVYYKNRQDVRTKWLECRE
ncbi:hypothetical protein [Rodentibacter haemolyticus]|uniref:Lipoprotein n=1 Tax=Rodentibacter haemolyticus TaxID=2778911 RepID=A0ABX6UZ83_9PAST|nr:hypothetical protein [Rodentibacter haemolyticus]QPB43388.1 hypothetical protein IHV77_04660 [Rodentibacter haemolyticus]